LDMILTVEFSHPFNGNQSKFIFIFSQPLRGRHNHRHDS
jgi:hypothetical protein